MGMDPELSRMAEDLRSELAWTPGTGWLAWEGKIWDFQFGGDAAANRVNRWREEAGYPALAVKPMLQTLRQLRTVMEISESALDTHPGLLNVQNGVVDLRTGELRPHDPALYLTRIAAVDYDPGAESPAWNQMLAALPTDSLSPLVAGAVTGHPAGSATVVHGPGLSGKSTFLRTLCDALGDHALYAGNWPPTDALRGVRFAVAEETGRINPGKLKILLTQDSIATRYPGRETLTFRPSHTLVLVTGPQDDRELDESTRRHLEYIGFSQLTILDPSLRPRLKETDALHAALAWAVDQALRAA